MESNRQAYWAYRGACQTNPTSHCFTLSAYTSMIVLSTRFARGCLCRQRLPLWHLTAYTFPFLSFSFKKLCASKWYWAKRGDQRHCLQLDICLHMHKPGSCKQLAPGCFLRQRPPLRRLTAATFFSSNKAHEASNNRAHASLTMSPSRWHELCKTWRLYNMLHLLSIPSLLHIVCDWAFQADNCWGGSCGDCCFLFEPSSL